MDYELASNQDSVDLWSDRRLPFEPKGDLRAMRDELRARLNGLRGDNLSAWLEGPGLAKFDIENVLFYNVGCSAFRASATRRLRFERRFTVPASTSGTSRNWHHHYTTAEVRSAWRRETLGVELSIRSATPLPSKAEHFWAAAHAARTASQSSAPAGGLFLRLNLRCSRAVNLTGVVKRITDGVCASFHTYAGPQLDEVAARASSVTGVDGSTARMWLQREGPLGPSAFVWPRGNSLQWSPADDRLVAVELEWSQLDTPGWELDVGLFAAVAS